MQEQLKAIGKTVQQQLDQLTSCSCAVFQEQLKAIGKTVQQQLDQLQTHFVYAYEQLNTIKGHECLYSCMERLFFKPMWPDILAVHKYVTQLRCSCSMHGYMYVYMYLQCQ